MRTGWLFVALVPLATTSRRGGFTKLAFPPLADCTTEKACPLRVETRQFSEEHDIKSCAL